MNSKAFWIILPLLNDCDLDRLIRIRQTIDYDVAEEPLVPRLANGDHLPLQTSKLYKPFLHLHLALFTIDVLSPKIEAATRTNVLVLLVEGEEEVLASGLFHPIVAKSEKDIVAKELLDYNLGFSIPLLPGVELVEVGTVLLFTRSADSLRREIHTISYVPQVLFIKIVINTSLPEAIVCRLTIELLDERLELH